ncbi:MAG: IclR family transcriptional regulator [Caldicoprobacterales bacterium]
MKKENHRTTSRVIEILTLVASSNDGLTLTDLAEKMKAPKSSIYPILKTLSNFNFLNYNQRNFTYRIGYQAFEIGNAYLNNFDLMEEIKTTMTNMVNVCSETCHYAILIEGDVLYLQKIDSPEPIRMFSSIGKRLPAYGTGLGKALLMDHNMDQLRSLYPNGLKKLTKNTASSVEELYDQLQAAKAEGFAYEVEESNEHIRCIAVPIRKNGIIFSALSVAIPVFRYTDEKGELIKHLLKNAKERIEKLLEQHPAGSIKF